MAKEKLNELVYKLWFHYFEGRPEALSYKKTDDPSANNPANPIHSVLLGMIQNIHDNNFAYPDPSREKDLLIHMLRLMGFPIKNPPEADAAKLRLAKMFRSLFWSNYACCKVLLTDSLDKGQMALVFQSFELFYQETHDTFRVQQVLDYACATLPEESNCFARGYSDSLIIDPLNKRKELVYSNLLNAHLYYTETPQDAECLKRVLLLPGPSGKTWLARIEKDKTEKAVGIRAILKEYFPRLLAFLTGINPLYWTPISEAAVTKIKSVQAGNGSLVPITGPVVAASTHAVAPATSAIAAGSTISAMEAVAPIARPVTLGMGVVVPPPGLTTPARVPTTPAAGIDDTVSWLADLTPKSDKAEGKKPGQASIDKSVSGAHDSSTAGSSPLFSREGSFFTPVKPRTPSTGAAEERTPEARDPQGKALSPVPTPAPGDPNKPRSRSSSLDDTIQDTPKKDGGIDETFVSSPGGSGFSP